MSLSNRLGLLGRKVGMMRIYTDDGDAVPVTVLDVSNNRVSQVKTVENDGYVALQVVFGARKASRVTKPEAGHLAKAGVEAGEFVKEFRVPAEVAAEYKAGATIAPAPCSRPANWLTCKAPRSVRASRAPSSATTSVRSVLRTVTRVRTTSPAPSRWPRTPVACSPASACLVTWVTRP